MDFSKNLFYPKLFRFFNFYYCVIYRMHAAQYFNSTSNLFLLHDHSKIPKWNWNLLSA